MIKIFKGKWNIIKMYEENGFDFLLQYVDSDTEQRSGKLTFPKGMVSFRLVTP